MPGGSRVSREAVARDREASRLRAAARRAARSAEKHEDELKARRRYEEANADHINELRRLRYGADMEALAARPFIFWDGEGYTTDDGAHHYMLFGCSKFPDNPLVGEDLSTEACLRYLLRVESQCPDAFHVGFAFDYDVNMILGDLASRNLQHLADYSVVHWRGYRIMYIPGKMFQVSKGPKDARVSVTVYDVFGFFHSKYVTSLIKFGVATREILAHIEEGKAERGNFTFADIEYVKKYWQDEVSYGPMLMNAVRDACYDAGLFVTQWHGPGALAAYMLRKRGVRKWMSKDLPQEVRIAIQYAYAGGRFMFWRCGLWLHPVYTADINSAYIYACSLLPRLDNGRWVREFMPTEVKRFAVYYIKYSADFQRTRDNHKAGRSEEVWPLFHRSKDGRLYWPHKTEGWYWSPEASLVMGDPDATITEAWVYEGDGTYPFEWVEEEFNKRLALQHEGNPAEKTFKWALAAMYGAFARLVGWDKKNRLPPKSHELAWAGFITSWCRAEVTKLARECQKRGGLVSIDTDGVTSTVPFEESWLDRGVGEKLGQWKLEDFGGILYWQSGFYWLMNKLGEWTTAKSRGIKRGSVDVQAAMQALEESSYELVSRHRPNNYRPAKIVKTQTKFTGFKEALQRHDGLKSWRRWSERTWEIRMGEGGTAWHTPKCCPKCQNSSVDVMHVITHKYPLHSTVSEPHQLPWLMEQPELHENTLIIRDDDEFDHL